METTQMKFVQTSDKSFYLMPMTQSCLFVQAIYSEEAKSMTVYSKLTHEMFDLIPVFSRSGQPKNPNRRREYSNGKRKTFGTYSIRVSVK